MNLFTEIKQDLFTPKGLAVTIIHNFVIVGALGSWIYFNVEVMGNDVAVSVPSKAAVTRR